MKVFRYYQHYDDGNVRIGNWTIDTQENRERERNKFYGTAEVRIQIGTLKKWSDLYNVKFVSAAHHEMMRHNKSFKG